VHQILSFIRCENSGIFDAYCSLDFSPAERHFLIADYGATFGRDDWLDHVREHWTKTYYACLARAVIKRRGRDYWQFHRRAFGARSTRISRRLLAAAIVQQSVDMCLNPKGTIEKLLAARQKRHPDRSVQHD
jgi:hypothetical protein